MDKLHVSTFVYIYGTFHVSLVSMISLAWPDRFLNQARAWFLEIAFVRDVGIYLF